MKDYKLSGSIVVYNKAEDAIKTVQSVVDNTGDNFSLYVIDNNSREKINEQLKKNFAGNYNDLTEDVGFGRGHNRGLAKINTK